MIESHDIHRTCRVAGREIPALQPTRLNIQAGQVFGLIGHSGAGENTLLRLINRLKGPGDGRILVEGGSVTALDAEGLCHFRRRVGMIFRHFNLLSSKTVTDNVAMPLCLASNFSRAEVDARVSELLAQVGLSNHVRKYPAQLSDGQKQRIDIACAPAYRPGILLYGETTNALDPQTTASVLRLLTEINCELELTVILITHEMDVIRRVYDQVAITDGGAIVKQGDVADVFLRPQHPTTRRFVFEAKRVDENERHDDFAHVPGLILRLTFCGEATCVPLLNTVVRRAGVDYSILSRRINRVKDTPYDQLALTLVGGDLEAATNQLNAVGVHVRVLR